MSNPYRNALAELHAASQLYTGLNPAAADVCPAELVRRLMEAMAASAALLAQPELPELTDEEIEEWADACSEAPLQEMDPEVHSWRRCFTAEEFSETIRAALIHWGHTPARAANANLRARSGNSVEPASRPIGTVGQPRAV